MRGKPGPRSTPRGSLAWFGLFLMATAVAWLQFFPERKHPVAVSNAPVVRDEFVSLIVLDPGHGGVDSGAMCAGVLEKDLTLDLAKRVQRLVHLQGFETMLTRDGDEYQTLANRAAFANRQRDCIFISIHFNDGKLAASSGVETYYASQQIDDHATPFSSWLPFLERTSSPSPNLQSQSLVANVHHPAVLVEGGFLTNKDDVTKLESDDYRERMAAAICEGILRYRDALRNRQPALAVTTPGS